MLALAFGSPGCVLITERLPAPEAACVPSDEVCNGADDDCDGLVDEEGAPVEWYPDADGDGRGDPTRGELLCAAPEGGVLQGNDCDDDDPHVYPGAPELCDGKQDDCDGSWSDDGHLVTFTTTDGEATDWTDRFAAGTAAAPADLDLDQDGALSICTGLWYVRLTVTATDLIVQAPEGAGSATLHAGQSGRVLTVRPGASSAALTLDGLLIVGGSADQGGGLATDATPLAILIKDSEFSGNEAAAEGGAVYFQAGLLSLENTAFRGNSAATSGGAIEAVDGTVTCTPGDETAEGFFSNSAPTGGAIHTLANGREIVTSAGCDWGTDEDGDDNEAADIYLGAPGSGRAFSFGANATFRCDTTDCG